MSTTRFLFVVVLSFVSLFFVACGNNVSQEQVETLEEAGALEARRSTAEEAAIRAFQLWVDVPYRNLSAVEVNSDGTFSDVRVEAEFRADPDSPWLESQAMQQCRKIGEEWECPRQFEFSLSPLARAMLEATREFAAITPSPEPPPVDEGQQAEIPVEEHEIAAAEAFQETMTELGIEYSDPRFDTLSLGEDRATVRVTAQIWESELETWFEGYMDVSLRLLGGWRTTGDDYRIVPTSAGQATLDEFGAASVQATEVAIQATNEARATTLAGQLALVVTHDGGTRFLVIDANGGERYYDPQPPISETERARYRHLAFSSDGQSLYFVFHDSWERIPQSIWRLDLNTEEVTAQFDAATVHNFTVITGVDDSPDGSQLLVSLDSPCPDNSRAQCGAFAVVPTTSDGASSMIWLDENVRGTRAVWSPGGELFAYVQADGTNFSDSYVYKYTIEVLDATGQPVISFDLPMVEEHQIDFQNMHVWTGDSAVGHLIDWSPDGRDIVSGGFELAVTSMEDATSVSLHEATGGSANDAFCNPVWTQDNRIVYTAGYGILGSIDLASGENRSIMESESVNCYYGFAWHPGE